MVVRRAYDLMYRWWAPWDAVGVREELRALLDEGVVDPARHRRVVDLGCGTGANVVFLSEQGFDAWGVDFSPVALGKARRRAEKAGVSAHFVEGDLTATEIPGLEGPFDLLLDFGTLDDLGSASRQAMAHTVIRLSRPGSLFLLWCFYSPRVQLPWISFSGPSRLAPAIEPGEEQDLFGDLFEIERRPDPRTENPAACFLMTRRPTRT